MLANVRILLLGLLLPIVSVHADDNWPQFRGHQASGIATGTPPTEFNVKTGQNVEWSVPVPGLGHSSPIVWSDSVFVTTAVSQDLDSPTLQTGWLGGTGKSPDDSGEWSWQLHCFDLKSGESRWTRICHRGEPVVKRHLKATHANCTPATDGQHVVAFFGSEGLFCFDFDGTLLWKRDFGRLHSGPYNDSKLQWGFSSSPIIHDGRVIVQCDCLNISFVAVLDIETGNELLRIDREGEVATWSTPAIVKTDHRTQIVCNGYHLMAGYDFLTGERLWHLKNGGDIPVPTPLFADNLIYLTNGHGRSCMFAIDAGATGNLTPDDSEATGQVRWWQQRDGSYMPTPLVAGGLIYTCNDNGRLTVRNSATGDLVYRQRVGSGSRTFSASAVMADGRLYFSSERGEVIVVAEGHEFRTLARSELGEVIMATPAIAGDRLLIRGVNHLFSMKQSDTAESPAIDDTSVEESD